MTDPDRDWIRNYFAGQTGRFLDIGAFDGFNSSLTYDLIEAGWSGVMVEPNPKYFLSMLERHQGNPRLEFVQAAVSPATTGLVKFWGDHRFGGELSTIAKPWRDRFVRSHDVPYLPYTIGAVTVGDLLASFGGPLGWRFVSIDAEGVSIELCRRLPLAQMVDTEILCVEWECDDSLIPFLEPYYAVAAQNQTNLIVKRK
jgi:FkbM family methyltransferase